MVGSIDGGSLCCQEGITVVNSCSSCGEMFLRELWGGGVGGVCCGCLSVLSNGY